MKRDVRRASVGRGLAAMLVTAFLTLPCAAQSQPDEGGSSGETDTVVESTADVTLEPIGEGRKQPPKPDKNHPEDPTITIDWGFGGSIPARRCVPVFVSLTGGLDPFSGFVTFRYRSDSTQSLAVTVPVAATPGKTSVYTPVLSYPGAGDKIEVVVSERSGRVVQRYWYAPSPGDTEIQLPSVRNEADPLVLAVGTRQSPAVSVLGMKQVAVPNRVNPSTPHALDVAPADPATLPTLAWAYEGVSVVVVSSDAVRSMDERATAALQEWVLGGGWVVVLAASGDESWAAWLPASAAPLRVAEPTNEPMPLTLARVVETNVDLDQSTLTGQFPTTASTWAGWRDSPQWMQGPSISESIVKPEPPLPPPPRTADRRLTATPVDDRIDSAAQLTLRWLRLTPEGRRAGWSVGLAPGELADEPEMGPSAQLEAFKDEGLMAQGPMGYGWVTVIGFDPRRMTAQTTNKASQRLWAHVFGLNLAARPVGEPVTRVLRGPPAPLATGWSGWGAWTGNVSDGGLALPLALDAVAAAEAPGRSVFLVVALAAAMVPLLIGPVDYLLMRRSRVANRSWLTALGWIGLASVAAWLLPLMMRSSTTTVSRLNAVDVMMPMAGTASAGREPLALQTGITGVFAAGTVRGTLVGLPDRATVRGVAADSSSWNGSGEQLKAASAGEAPIAQAGPAVGAAPTAGEGMEGWGGFPLERSESDAFGDRMLETAWRLWTFRALEDRARIRGTVAATLERLEGRSRGGAKVVVTGLPAGAKIERAAVVCNGVWRELKMVEGASAGAVAFESKGLADRGEWEPRSSVRVESQYAYYEAKIGPTLDKTPGAALALRGAYERGDVIESRVESGAWDAVYLHVTGLPASVSLEGSTKNTEQAVYRIVIPVGVEGPAR